MRWRRRRFKRMRKKARLTRAQKVLLLAKTLDRLVDKNAEFLKDALETGAFV